MFKKTPIKKKSIPFCFNLGAVKECLNKLEESNGVNENTGSASKCNINFNIDAMLFDKTSVISD